MQLLFPVACTFTPAIVHAQATTVVSAQDAERATRVYTLSRGESVQSVARQYHLSVEELRKLNQFRTFAHGFTGLQPGDELDVPAAQNVKNADNKPDTANAPDEQEQKIAGLASQAGSFLSSSPDGQAAQSMAVGMVAGEASNHLQQILGRYGTARVQLGVDDGLSLKNSEFDLLLPIWEQESTLFYSQGSLHRTDDRTQSNLGLGVRYFTDSWMVGGNTFLDYDLSRDHSRLGLGLEYGRDFLKLSANSYQRLSNWKDSPDVDDYEERPANGWDLRAEGWLPALPQLGGRIIYEQYYGDEVALSDKDNRQHNPHAITAGINYTPIPLMTLRAEQQQGTSDDDETRLALELNYQLGVPWLHQIDPDGVAGMHTLAGSRYDLVDRNSNIVLEYRKQDVIRLKTAALVTGNGGERKSLGVAVNSKHGVKRIDWSAATLLAAGGKIIANSTTSYDVLLPSWKSEQGASNSYTITGVAVDNNDNHSDPSDTQVTVNTAAVNVANSTFLPDSPLKSSPTTSYLPADGKTHGVATLTLVDDQKQPVDVPLTDITLTTTHSNLPASTSGVQGGSKGLKASSESQATISALTRKSVGVYEVTVTAGTQPELVTLTPTVSKTPLPSVRFIIIKAAPDGNTSTFAANPKTVTADNTATSTLTLVAKDASGNPLSGVASAFSVAITDSHNVSPVSGTITVTNMTETATAGTYTATLKGSKADTWTLKPLYNSNPIGTLADTVTLTAGNTPDAEQSTFSLSPKLLPADGIASSTLTLTLKDSGGNVLTGVADSLTAVVTDSQGHSPADDSLRISSLTETATAGIYTATLTGTLAGSYKVKPQFNRSDIGNLSDTVTLTASRTPDVGKSTFSASPTSVAADNIAASTLTLTVQDENGNAIAGIASSLSLIMKDSGGNTPAADKVTLGKLAETSTAGTYTTTLKGTLAGTYTVIPQFNAAAMGDLHATVTLTGGSTPDGTRSTFHSSPKIITADNSESSTLTLVIKDSAGNAITDSAGKLSFALKDSDGTVPTADNVVIGTIAESATPGTYTATLKGTRAGAYTLTPLFDGNAINPLSDGVVLKAGTTPDGVQSTFNADPVSIPANNLDMSTLTLQAKDGWGNAITNLAPELTLEIKDGSGNTPTSDKVTVGSVTETATAGTYIATLKGTLAGTYTLKPLLNGSAINGLSATVHLTGSTVPDGSASTFSANPTSIAANNTETSTLTLTAKDVSGNAVSGIAANLTLEMKNSQGTAPDSSKLTLTRLTETGTAGTYTATLKGELADSYTVTPMFNGSPLGDLSDTVTLTAGTTPDNSLSTFSATPKSIAANNTAVSLLSLNVKDKNGNGIPGIAASLAIDVQDSKGETPAEGVITLSAVTEGATPGTYVATLKGQLADTYTVKPQFNGAVMGELGDTVTLKAGTTPDTSKSTFVADPVSIAADNSAVSTLTLTLQDVNGNAMTGEAGDLSLTLKNSQGTSPASDKVTLTALQETGTTGVYTATLKGSLADTYTVTPELNGDAIGSLNATVTLTAGSTPDGSASTFSASPTSIAADDSATSTLTLLAKDASGNAVTGIASALTLEIMNSLNAAPADGNVTVTTLTEGTPGTYTATLKGQLADVYTVTPKFNGGAIGNLSDTVTLTAGITPDVTTSAFTAQPHTVAADGVATSTLLFTAKDHFGNHVRGLASGLSIEVQASQSATPDSSKVIVSGVSETGSPGLYAATLKGTLTGTYTVKPLYNGSALGDLRDTVTLKAGTTPDTSKSTFVADPISIAADNSAVSTLTLTLQDVNGNAMTGEAGDLSLTLKNSQGTSPASDKVTLTALQETGTTGVYTATLKGTLADTYTVTPELNSDAIGSLNATVTLTAGSTPDDGQSTFMATPDSIAADNTDSSTLILTLKDSFGNVLSGQTGNLTFAIKNGAGNAPAESDVTITGLTEIATPGTYTATLKGKKADVWHVTPEFSGSAMEDLTATVTLNADTTPDGTQSSFTVTTPVIANNRDTSTLTLTAKDANGNGISGIALRLKMRITDSQDAVPPTDKVMVGSVSETSTPGVYTAMLKGTLAGVYTVEPTFDGTVIAGLSGAVTLTADAKPDGLQSTFAAAPVSVSANNTDASTLTLTTKDAYGNVISGIANSLSLEVKDSSGTVPDSNKVVLSNVTESATSGTYTATLKGTLTGVYTVKPLYNSSAVDGLSATVTLTAGETDGGQSDFRAAPDSIVADNAETSALTLVLKDANGNAVTGKATALSVEVTDQASGGVAPAPGKITIDSMTESASEPGTYTSTLRGMQAGEWYLTAHLSGTAIAGLASQKVTLEAGEPDTGKETTFVANPDTVAADNVTRSTLTLTAKDKYGNVVSGLATKLTLALKDSKGTTPASGVTLSEVSEEGTTGVYTATLTGTLADVYTVTPQYNGSVMGDLTATVTLTAGAPDDTVSTFTAAPERIVADNVTPSVLTLKMQDVYGNAISGRAKDLTLEIKDSLGQVPAEDRVTLTTLSESSSEPGTYTATLKGTSVDTYTLTPKLGGSAIGSLSADVILTADSIPDGGQSAFSADPASVVADGLSVSTLSLELKDKFGNVMKGQTSALSLEITDSAGLAPDSSKVVLSGVTESSTPGTYIATIKGTLVGDYTVKPLFNSSAIDGLSATVALTAGVPMARTLSANPSTVMADNTPSALTLVVTDANGNAIPGLTDSLSFTVTDGAGTSVPEGKVEVVNVKASDTTPGSYTATLKGTLVGAWTVTPLINSTPLGTVSTVVTLTAGAPDAAQSSISTSPKSIKADNSEGSTITIELKDAYGNAVSGYGPDNLDKLSIYVEDSRDNEVTSNISWGGALEESTTTPGTYTRILKGKVVDTLTVRPQIGGANLGDIKDTVTLEGALFKDINSNGYTFAIGSNFPDTGFNGAKFTLNMPSGKTASNYTWSSNQSWVTVTSAGLVTFGDATSSTKKVTITAISNSTGEQSLAFTFTIGTWYLLDLNNHLSWDDTNSYCSSQNAAMPNKAQMTSGTNIRGMGSLWAEWGSLLGNIADKWYRVSDMGVSYHLIVRSIDGGNREYYDSVLSNTGTACFISF
ncbi:invasin domain 3-containing protein [Citrobacter freundii complex sp. CFNIH2]|uniref:invasin domain 3-containing protein n=1 Tax=Citrobacter freundii complex sp. CFNIH2 TaxID=2066049 RepID=UPI0016520CA7|nr:invasin domain 3-containing protein [Citrobacter freundii complex sp. CFNIH2]